MLFERSLGDLLVISTPGTTPVTFSGVAAMTWLALAEPGSVEEVTEALCEVFELDPLETEPRVLAICQAFEANGFVTRC